MELVPVRSGNLVAVGYDPSTQELQVTFKRGGWYSYDHVPANVHAGLMAATSRGSYFNAVIRDRYVTHRLRRGR